MTKLVAGVFAGFAAAISSFFGGHGHMTSTPPNDWRGTASSTWSGGMREMPAVFGKVSAIDGTTLTVLGRAGTTTMATTTFSVDASNAKILKGSATTTVSIGAIAVGDFLGIEGTVSGTSVTATTIHDGLPPRMNRPMGGPGRMGSSTASSTRPWPGSNGGMIHRPEPQAAPQQ